METLPQIQPSAYSFGLVALGPFSGVPICGILGDQQASLVGHGGFTPGSVKNTYGTGCFLLVNTGEKPLHSSTGLLTTVAYVFPGVTAYALEGSVAVAGSGLQWLCQNLQFAPNVPELVQQVDSVPDAGGVVFVTALSGGLFAPFWRPDATGTLVGLSLYSTKAHIIRAACEATAWQTRGVLDAVAKDMKLDKSSWTRIAVDGGVTLSDAYLRVQADVLGFPLLRPLVRELTARGAVVAAKIGCGLSSFEDERNKANDSNGHVFSPSLQWTDVKRNEAAVYWENAVKRSFSWPPAV